MDIRLKPHPPGILLNSLEKKKNISNKWSITSLQVHNPRLNIWHGPLEMCSLERSFPIVTYRPNKHGQTGKSRLDFGRADRTDGVRTHAGMFQKMGGGAADSV